MGEARNRATIDALVAAINARDLGALMSPCSCSAPAPGGVPDPIAIRTTRSNS